MPFTHLLVALLVCLVSVTFAAQPDQDDPDYVNGTLMQLPDGSYYMRTDDRKRHRIHLQLDWPDAKQEWREHLGKRVRVRRKYMREDIYLPDPRALEMPQSGAPWLQQSPQLLEDHIVAGAIGVKSIGIIKVAFADAAPPYQLGELQTLVAEIGRRYREYSGGLVFAQLDGVFGPFTIQMRRATCDPLIMAAMADQAAGINLNFFTNIIYQHPFSDLTPACRYFGLGSVGGNPADMWWNGNVGDRTTAHELGHNLGWFHSHARRCTGGVLTEPCLIIDLGNPADLMGSAQAAHPGLWQQWHARWIGALGRPPVGYVDGSGFFRMGPFAAPGAMDKGVVVPIPESNYAYGLEFRWPVAGTYDAELAAWPGLSSTILVNRAHLEDPNQIELLDMTPQTAEFTDAGLAIGQLYADASAGLSMWPISLTDAGADVLIQRDTDQLVVQIIPNQGGIPHRRHVRYHHASHHQRPPGSGRQPVDEFDLCGDTVCPGAHHDRGQWRDRDDRADPSRLGTGHVYIVNGGGLGTEEDGSDDA